MPWRDTAITLDDRGKPIYRDPATGECPIAFNVSHQAGLVVLIAVHGYTVGPVEVGVDVVCTSERRERDPQGRLQRWLADPSSICTVPSSPHPRVRYLKNEVVLKEVSRLRGVSTPKTSTDYRLRCFYTLWCLREAYVKLTGEALLADWLSELEFRNFRPPDPTAAFTVPARGGEGDEKPGGRQVIRTQEIYFKGQKIEDVGIVMRSLGPDFMICSVVRTPQNKADALGWHLGSIPETLARRDSRNSGSSSLTTRNSRRPQWQQLTESAWFLDNASAILRTPSL